MVNGIYTLVCLYAQQLDMDTQEAFMQKKVNSIAAIINESLSDLRSFSKNLTDTNQVFISLYELINNECARVNAIGTCTAILHANTQQIPVSQAIRNFVLRILQEFIQNSLKHADCSQINISFQLQPAGLKIEASDNGKGFVMNNEVKGIGLKNMNKRAEIIGARFALQSTLDSGTSVELFIPAHKFNL